VPKRAYIFPFVHLFVAESQVMWAFSQAAWVLGVFPANAGPLNATARPSATIIDTMLFMVSFSHIRCLAKNGTSKTPTARFRSKRQPLTLEKRGVRSPRSMCPIRWRPAELPATGFRCSSSTLAMAFRSSSVRPLRTPAGSFTLRSENGAASREDPGSRSGARDRGPRIRRTCG
jgi:hypothetical protein